MKKFATGILFSVLAGLAGANAQVVPVGSTGQHLVARFYAGVDCTKFQPTGFGTATLYLPYIAGIQTQFLFKAGATVQDETTAVLTGVFGKVGLSQSTNYNVVNTFLSPQTVSYYYHPNSSPKDWTDFDGFQAGTLIATYQVKEDMFTTINGVSLGVVSGPFTYSADFTLPDGTTANLANFMPGGGTFTTFAALGSFVTTANGQPQVLNLTTGAGPFILGSCAVMTPFSGTGTNPSSENSTLQIKGLDKTGAKPEADR